MSSGVTEISVDAASQRFNSEASTWDDNPSIISATKTMSAHIKKMDWYTSTIKAKDRSLRAMDFGCGTGLLTYKILDPNVFHEIVGVDVSEGMIKTFQQKIRLDNQTQIKMSAVCTDLSKISLATLNDTMVFCKADDLAHEIQTGFDVVYSLLTFHHIERPEFILNEVLKDEYLNNGGRIILMDYEHDKTKQIFHPEHLKEGEHYEHDGFVEKDVRKWFKKGNHGKSKKKWDLKTLDIKKVPYLAPVDPDWEELVPERKLEIYNMFVVTCCTV